MEREITEADWKVFTKLKELALDRYCARVLTELKALMDDQTQTNHERYLSAFRRLRERDKDLAMAFNDHSRSKASLQLLLMRRLELLTDDEMNQFSPAYRERIANWFGFAK